MTHRGHEVAARGPSGLRGRAAAGAVELANIYGGYLKYQERIGTSRRCGSSCSTRRERGPGRAYGPGLSVRSGTVASAGRSRTCSTASTTVSGRIQPRRVVLLALLGVHLLLHRRGDAAGVDRGHADAVLVLLGAQRVGEGADAELRGGVGRPGRVGGRRPAPELTRTTVPRAARSGGRSSRASTHGGGEVDVELLLPVREVGLGDRRELDDAGDVHQRVEPAGRSAAGQRALEPGPGRRGRPQRSPRAAGASGRGPLLAAGEQHQPVATLEQPARELGTDARAGAGQQVGAVAHCVNTILPKTSPSAIAAKPSRACSIGSARSISGRVPVASSRSPATRGRRGCPSWSRPRSAGGRRSG